MAGCKCENWTLQDLSSALQNMHTENKRIVVPTFQRGKRWKKAQEQTFIDSLMKGYPVGTMLFYETFEDGQMTYILVDGLQRANSIRKYMNNPTEFFYDDSISDEFCQDICTVLKINDKSQNEKIRSILSNFIKEQKTFKGLQYYSVANKIRQEFGADYNSIDALIDSISVFFNDRQELYERIASTVIPVIVYTGDENSLPEIFDRINSQGTPLDQYEVYAASWPIKREYTMANSEIVEYVIKKYDSFIEDDYQIHDYSSAEMRSKKQLNAFEYLFGLGKFLVNNYEILSFNKKIADDTVNPLAFELVNACLNDTDRIKTLYMNLQGMDVNALEKALLSAIDFVNGAISKITKFKGNSRENNKVFHSKYQILSMISTTFKEMYPTKDFSKVAEDWPKKKGIIAENLVQYYVYDIITNYWSEGGTGKIHAAAKPNRYMNTISSRSWMVALDGFFERSMQRSEPKKVAKPRSEEYVILNCIYMKTFTAQDQLSTDRFDVEHIATKEQMRKMIEACKGEGLPISCIANLCYLPEFVNRSKRDKNFYQDTNYLRCVDLKEVEEKYSFTEEADLEWMDMPYEKKDDFEVLKEYYTEFCTKRFDKLKHLFCEALSIQYEEIAEEQEKTVIVPNEPVEMSSKKVQFADKCVQKLAQKLNVELIKTGRSTFVSTDRKNGYVICTSKAYRQGKREKYWFAYRQKNLNGIEDCENKYVIYGCLDENTLVQIPVSEIESHLKHMNTSKDDEGNIAHWHIVLFKDKEGKMTWMFSHPDIREIDITDKVL